MVSIEKRRRKIFIATPHTGNIRAELGLAWVQWLTNPRYLCTLYPLPHRRPVTVARNEIITTFLETDYEFLFMIDSDQTAVANILDLSLLDKDVIGALCYMNKDDVITPSLMRRVAEGYTLISDKIPLGNVVEVDATGTGCIMIHRRVLEAVPPPWFEYEFTDEGLLAKGDDFIFCDKVKEYGFNIYVHTGVLSPHFQTVDISKYAKVVKADDLS